MTKAPANELIIEGWQAGISASPEVGFGLMANTDIYSYPGVVRQNYTPTKQNDVTINDLVIGMRINPLSPTNIFALDKKNNIYQYTSSWASLAGNSDAGTGTGTGIAIWKDYLFVCGLTKLDVYGPLSSSPAWSGGGSKGVLNWQTLSSYTWHTMLESVDDRLYICNGKNVALLYENPLTTFNPNDSSTYTFSATTIALPAYEVSKCLADLGSQMVVGTYSGTDVTSALTATTIVQSAKVANLYPFQRGDLSQGVVLKLNKNGVHAMLSVNNRLYIQAGIAGEIFATDSVTFSTIVDRVPNYVANLDSGKFMYSMPGAIMWHQNRLWFGLSSTLSIGNMGVYSVNPTMKGAPLVVENYIASGATGNTSTLEIGALLSLGWDRYILSEHDNSTYGIEKIDDSSRRSSTNIETPLYHIGEALGNKTVSQIEVYFQRPLASGDGLTISYRKDLTSSFTALPAIDYTTYNGSANLQAINVSGAQISNAVFLQLRLALSGNAELKRVTLKF